MLRYWCAGCVLLLPAIGQVGCGTSASFDQSAESHSFAAPAESISGIPAAAPTGTALPAPLSRDVTLPNRPSAEQGRGPGRGGDKYSLIVENAFVSARDNPLSTFSIDVDTASYSKARMYLLQYGSLPPPDAVRIEELINYFDYDYSGPADEHPFAVHVECTDAPWKPGHRLARIGLQGRTNDERRPAANLVFLVDVSGSMDQPNRLPLVKQSLQMLASHLGERDQVSIVVYAGAAGVVLPATHGDDGHRINAALERLRAGGSTNGGEGIQLAYRLARQTFVAGGVNRVVLCTDGDFNVGTTSTGELVRMAEQEARSGVFLTVLGFGMGNHNDAMLEQLSNKANGNYAFIDTLLEARKVLCEQLQSTLVTIAKDVKIQVEFNPARVAAYRLIGYENRRLAAQDFNDDTKDAGEIGAGHTVTALYEWIPVGEAGGSATPSIDPLKYQRRESLYAGSEDLMTVKLRYKQPRSDVSQKIEIAVRSDPTPFPTASADLRFAAAVAEFGMLLRKSSFCGNATYDSVLEIGQTACGADRLGYRAEFLQIVAAAQRLTGGPQHSWARPVVERDPSVVIHRTVHQPATVPGLTNIGPYGEHRMEIWICLAVIAAVVAAYVVLFTITAAVASVLTARNTPHKC